MTVLQKYIYRSRTHTVQFLGFTGPYSTNTGARARTSYVISKSPAYMLKRDIKTLPLKSTCSQTDFHFEKHNLALVAITVSP